METTDIEASDVEHLLGVDPSNLLRLAWLTVLGLFVVWVSGAAGPATLLGAASGEEMLAMAARRLRVGVEEARGAVRWLAGRESAKVVLEGSWGEEPVPEDLGARLVACALVALPRLLALLLLPPFVAGLVRAQLERAKEEVLSFGGLRAQLQEPVLAYVADLLRDRDRGRGGERSGAGDQRAVRTGRNRARQQLSRHVATATLARAEALGEALVTASSTTDLDRLARHERTEDIVQELREAREDGCSTEELRSRLSDALAEEGGAATGEEPTGPEDPAAILEACRTVTEARTACGVIGLGVFLVPMMEGFPLLEQLWLVAEECPAGFRKFHTACRICKLGRPCPAGTRAVVPRRLWDWLRAWRDAIQGTRRRLPAELLPLLLPCAEGDLG